MIFNTSIGFNVETKDVKYLDAGIHENVDLVSAKQDRSTNGNEYIEILFERDGAKVSQTEYEPKKFGDESDESLQAKADGQVKRIMQILKCFYPKEVLVFTGDSFAGFAAWVVALINNAPKTKVRLKVVYGNNGFTGLPRYYKYTFIEPMTISSSDSKISQLSIDKFERQVLDTEPEAETSASVFGATSKTATVEDSPF
jgi:hypothetical protein